MINTNEQIYYLYPSVTTGVSEPYFIDTNVFIAVYTNVNINNNSEKVKAYFELLSEKDAKYGYISIQNIVEFVNVTKNKIKCFNNSEDLNGRTENIASLFNIVYYNQNTITRAVALSYKIGIGFFDALLAQTMLENNIHLIYTENTKDFNKIPGIKAINPFTDKKIARLCERAKKQRQKYQAQAKQKK